LHGTGRFARSSGSMHQPPDRNTYNQDADSDEHPEKSTKPLCYGYGNGIAREL